VRVVIAEDAVLLRAGLVRLLSEAGHDVVAEVDDGPSLVAAVTTHEPDLAIIDVRMPPTHTHEGLRAALDVRSRLPETKVLVLSQYVEVDYASDLLADNAAGVGYLLKDRIADVSDFLVAVARVGANGTAIDPEVVSELLGRRRRRATLDTLTPREREVLALMAEGRSNSSIAAAITVTEGAVEKHIRSIFMKLGLLPTDSDHRRVLAVLTYLQC
jgi:DNA-binding NarL/FixJ family response regulator